MPNNALEGADLEAAITPRLVMVYKTSCNNIVSATIIDSENAYVLNTPIKQTTNNNINKVLFGSPNRDYTETNYLFYVTSTKYQ